MDYILLCQPEPFTDKLLTTLQNTLGDKGVVIAPEKVQRQAPWKYLGWLIYSRTVAPQKVELTSQILTLNDFQKLVGELQWVCNLVGLTNQDLHPLMALLRGTDPPTRIPWDAEHQNQLKKIGAHILQSPADRRCHDLPISLLVCNHAAYPFALLLQWPPPSKEKGGDTR